MTLPKSCVNARQIHTYTMLSERRIAVGNLQRYIIAKMVVSVVGYIGLSHIYRHLEELFTVGTPDDLLYNRSPIVARVSYGGGEADITRFRVGRPIPLGFGMLGVSFATRGKGVPVMML